jgi:hypothetical protein
LNDRKELEGEETSPACPSDMGSEKMQKLVLTSSSLNQGWQVFEFLVNGKKVHY